MSLFDIFKNIIQAGTVLLFIKIACEDKRYSKYFVYTLCLTISMITQTYYSFPYSISNVIDYIIIFLYATSISKGLSLKNILISTLPLIVLNIANSLSLLAYNFALQGYISFKTLIIISKILFLFLTIVLSKILIASSQYNKKVSYLFYIVIIIINQLFSLVFEMIFFKASHLIIIVIYLIALSIFTMVLVKAFTLESKQTYETKLQNQILLQQKQSYEMIKETLEESKRIKHDLKHVCHHVLYELNQENIQSAVSLLQNELNNIQDITHTVLSGNETIDFLLNQYKEQTKDVTMIILNIDQDIPLSPSDQFIIFGNLIQNAIENCEGKRKTIKISLKKTDDYMFICFENSAVKRDCLEGTFKTTKLDSKNHGYGLQNTIKLLDHYKGTLILKSYDHEFIAKVCLPINKGTS